MEKKLRSFRDDNKVRVLVFPCGSEIGLELHRSLAWSKHVDLIGASSVKSNHGKYIFQNYVEDVPFVNEPEFISEINNIVERHQIDFIYPAHDSVVLKLASCQQSLTCEVICSPLETCEACRSKSLTYRTFEDDIRVPRVFDNSKCINEFPVFLKPDEGQGSKGTHVAHSKADVDFYLKKDPSLLILEYLPGAEFTVDCFTDRHGVLRFVGGRERIRIQSGISVNARQMSIDGEFQKYAEIINNKLTLRGAWFFQLKEAKNRQLTLMEIAPRVAGTMGLYRNLGVNFALLSIYDRLDIDVKILLNSYSVELDRALISRFLLRGLKYEAVYIDLDDTLIVNRQVNTILLAFLYQCLNEGKKLFLISRHRGNIDETLKKYRLEGIFDAVFQIEGTEEKLDYIQQETAAIFIDDSFSERETVSQGVEIPVFDLDAVESLLDWRL